MKGDYFHEEANNIFAKFHQLRRGRQTSELEEESRSSIGGNIPKKPKTTSPQYCNISTCREDGATIEVVRRPRGRPMGSKNKPKPPLIVTPDTHSAMLPLVLEIPSGFDVLDSIARFSLRQNVCLSVLTGSGTVSDVSLYQPSNIPEGFPVTFHGHFDILSISATFLPPSSSSVPNSFTISLAGPHGQIVAGSVAGALLAVGSVFIVAASFASPSYHRFPFEDEVPNSGSGCSARQLPSESSVAEENHPTLQESCGMSIYSRQLPSDVIWAPTAIDLFSDF